MMSSDREALKLFCEESQIRLDRIRGALERFAECRPMNIELLHGIFRDTHSLKGAANLLKLRPVELLAHKLEDILESLRSGSDVPDKALLDILAAGYARIEQLLRSRHILPLIDVSKDISAIEQQLSARHSSGK
jgi:chemotaxis protein histidine kinase CheA